MSNTINYDPNTPTVTLPYADWQIQFIQNFTQFNTAFSQDHVPLTDPTNQGNHTYVHMPEQPEDSAPQTGSNEFSIYAKNVEDQTDQLFFVYPGNTPIVQFTNYQIYSVQPRVSPNIAQTTFFTFLPGGLLIYFGSYGPFTSSATGSKTETDNTLFLNPPIAKNIAGVNFCIKGTTPDFTPSCTFGPLSIVPGKGFIQEGNITQLFIAPHTGAKNTTIDYLVIANI